MCCTPTCTHTHNSCRHRFQSFTRASLHMWKHTPINTHCDSHDTQRTTHKGTYAKHIPEGFVGLLECTECGFADYSQWVSFSLLSPDNLPSASLTHQSTNTHRMPVDTCSVREGHVILCRHLTQADFKCQFGEKDFLRRTDACSNTFRLFVSWTVTRVLI